MATATNNELLQLSGTVDLTAAAADSTKPVKVSIVGYTGNTMSVSGWRNPLAVELSGVALPASIPLLSDHRAELDGVLGTATPRVSGSTLTAEGVLSHSSVAAQRIIGLSRDGVSFQSSMGLEVQKSKDFRPGETAVVNGRSITAGGSGLTVVLAARLRELSILSLGADGNTSVAISAQRNKTMAAELNTDTQLNADQAALDVAQAERLRCAAIVDECKSHPQIATQAINSGWTPAKAALEVLKAGYPTMPNVQAELQQLRADRATPPAIGSGRRVNDRDFLECALALNAGTPETFVAEHYGEQLMNAALTPHGRRIGIHDVLRSVCAAVGEHLHPGRLTASDIKQAFRADMQLKASGFSTISIPGILGNVTGKSLLSAYQAANSVARRIARSASLPDFKAGHTAYRLTGSGMIEQVGKGGELKHTTVREDSYTNQLSTYGKMLQITREDIINDDLNAFGEIPRVFGRQTALAVEDKLFTLLLANTGSFFSTGNLNYQEGAATNLQLSSLDSLMQKFLDQVDNDGKPVLISPAILLVPTTLAATARQLISSLELVGSTMADVLRPNANPFSKSLEVLTSPYLNNTSYTGYSTKAWYLFANPGDVAALEIAYLNGQQSPTVETAEADFNTLGVAMRVFFDFGIAFQDPRAAAKSKGEN